MSNKYFKSNSKFPNKINCIKKVDCLINVFCVAESLLYYAAISWKERIYAKHFKGICKTFKKALQTTTMPNVQTCTNKTRLSIEYWSLTVMQLNSKL